MGGEGEGRTVRAQGEVTGPSGGAPRGGQEDAKRRPKGGQGGLGEPASPFQKAMSASASTGNMLAGPKKNAGGP